MSTASADDPHATDIAIVGMAGRFPQANDIHELWTNLRAGRECITFFSDAELRAAGLDEELIADPSYVKARGVLAGADLFDAGFFGVSPREAELTDPQQRVFLECAWTALEHAGIHAESYPGRIGVYAGAGWNSYLIGNLASDPTLLASDAGHLALLGNEKDTLTTRVSYKLNLTGPSLAVQTGCSSSLVAVGLACQSLLHYQCDIALAGGVSIIVPQTGHVHRPGGILSPDGHCRAFDRDARGTVLGSGAGIIVLKRLADARADNDTILAIIKAAIVNNDGCQKLAFTAPSVEGQAEAILDAHAHAGISADTISYVEAHGTGTALGDPVEIAALTRAFRASTERKGFCAIGSVKTNIGHLDAAAGVAGLIKTVLAMIHEEIPPSLHYTASNPEIDFANSPFFVNTQLTAWPAGDVPRRAAVSSFGLGGTNAHVILQEAPQNVATASSVTPQLLPLSARTPAALDALTDALLAYLRAHPDLDLASVAYTLQVGRKPFERRRAVVCAGVHEAIDSLAAARALAPRRTSASANASQNANARETAHANTSKSATALSMWPREEGAPRDYRAPSDERAQLTMLADRWLSGDVVDWHALHGPAGRRRIPLPTYPFERQRYWIDPPSPAHRSRPGPASDARAAFADVARSMTREAVRQLDVPAFQSRQQALDTLSRLYMQLALDRLGLLAEPWTNLAIAADRAGVRARYVPLIRDWLSILAQASEIANDGESRRGPSIGPRAQAGRTEAGRAETSGTQAADSVTLATALADAQRAWTDAPQIVELVRTCGAALPDVLTGKQDPAELFVSIIAANPDAAFSDPFVDERFRALLGEGMKRVSQSNADATLRILEIGSGTGMGTAAILPVLARDRTKYTITDVATGFLRDAARRFADYPFVDYRLLDLDRSPESQGFVPGSYDIVVAANALHVGKDTARSLAHVRTLLAPDGLLIAWEITNGHCDFAITYALVMEPPEDADRSQASPFLTAAQWRAALAARQFTQIELQPHTDTLAHHILLASADSSSAATSAAAFSAPAPRTSGERAAASGPTRHADIADWFQVPSWKRCPPAGAAIASSAADDGPWLVFLDPHGWGATIADRLARLGSPSHVVTVTAGSRLHRTSDAAWTLAPDRDADYAALFQALADQGRSPSRIVYAWSLFPVDATVDATRGTSERERPQSAAAYDLMKLARAFGERDEAKPLTIFVLSNGVHDVTGVESLEAATATLLGPCRVIPLEYPGVACRNIDVDQGALAGGVRDLLVTRVIEEMTTPRDEPIIALRGGHRWTPALEPVRLPAVADNAFADLRPGSVFLITGGLGQIGLTLAEDLARGGPRTFVLTSRTPFPAHADWQELLATRNADDRLASQIAALTRIDALGSTTLVLQADVTSATEMRVALATIRKRFGRVNAVIHAAGVLGNRSIQLSTREDFERVLAPKVAGTLLLESLLEDDPPELFVVFSSLSALKPAFGQAAYAAANSFLDAFVHARARRHTRYRGISWDVWQGDGMAYDAAAPLALRELRDADFALRGIRPDEGQHAFRRAIASGLPHLLVCTSDYLSVASTEAQDVPRMYLRALAEPAHTSPQHPRPDTDTPYVCARSAIELRLVDAWSEVLGISGIGIDDDFFEMGGDSLIVMQLTARVVAGFGVKLPSGFMYDTPTVRAMAAFIEAATATAAGVSAPHSERSIEQAAPGN